jgi:hypothetical protein
MHTWTAMEMDTFKGNTHLFNFFHPLMNFLGGINIISEFSWESCQLFVSFFLLYRYPPKNTDIWGILLDFHKLI